MNANLDFLGHLDPDDPRQASQQIANKLRAAILTRKLSPGDKLPSQPELAARYGVAQEAVKRARQSFRPDQRRNRPLGGLALGRYAWRFAAYISNRGRSLRCRAKGRHYSPPDTLCA
ncbi:MAG TPA: GntR family transcriptional regulator [Streptosporangiaceae bacterium]|nr:GntR family transcriptional regulator [Streptosporangiaceae bacterium]